jgi:nucleotide sugar dehydrogenase
VDLVASDRERLSRWVSAPELELTAQSARLEAADGVIICVPTPVDEHRMPDMRALEAACATVVQHAVAGQTIILTSTSYVGTTREFLVEPLRARGFVPGLDIFVAFAPERIDPGNVRHPQESVPRVVGGYSPSCADRAAAIVGHVAPVERVSSPEAAELTKLYENTFRAVNIALVDEFESLSRRLGVDMTEVVRAASSKPFGFMPFTPGTGVGGHCIPCDPHYLLWQLQALHHDAPLIDRAMKSIEQRPMEMVDWLANTLSERGVGLAGAKILIVGVAYKPGVEDLRESPALEIIEEVRRRQAHVEYHDPLIPVVHLSDGSTMRSVTPDGGTYDAALIHVVQPGSDLNWLAECDIVLDPSGRTRRRELVAVPMGPPHVVGPDSSRLAAVSGERG